MNHIITNETYENMLDEMSRPAYCDYLTGLANRRGLYQYYDDLDKSVVVHAVFIDIDNFNRVNDNYGHKTGDELLIAISRLIRQTVEGFVSRIAGDEFVVFIDGDKQEAEALSRWIHPKDGLRSICIRWAVRYPCSRFPRGFGMV